MLELENKKLLEQWSKAKKYGEELEKRLAQQIEDKTLFEQLFTLMHQSRSEEKCKHEEKLTEFQKIKSHLKEEYSKSQISLSQFGDTPSKISRNITIASKVFSFISRPQKGLPKSIMAPLPVLRAIEEKPSSTTLDKLIIRKNWWTSDFKTKFISKLFSLCIELVKVTRKLFSLKPS